MDDLAVEQGGQGPGACQHIRVVGSLEQLRRHDEQVGSGTCLEVTLVGDVGGSRAIEAGAAQGAVESDGLLRVEGLIRSPAGAAPGHGRSEAAPGVGRLDRCVGTEGQQCT